MSTLSETADEMEAAAESLHAKGLFEEASKLRKAALAIRRHLRAESSPLTKAAAAGRLPREMEAAHRQKLSEAQTGKKIHPMLAEARKHGMHSVGDMAKALGYSKSMMSRILSGDREMGEEAAAEWSKRTKTPWRRK